MKLEIVKCPGDVFNLYLDGEYAWTFPNRDSLLNHLKKLVNDL